ETVRLLRARSVADLRDAVVWLPIGQRPTRVRTAPRRRRGRAYARPMLRALILVARWIGEAHDRWFAAVGRLRPLYAVYAALRVRFDRVREENDLLRARLGRLEPHRRPHYRPWERLRILWHQAK